ncbi:RWD domain protein [Dictyocaulus viviparus]|uniref:RWD domain protein n=1 Tax=Dictyocaulus viviparus TaxID=29172 RepID=A0A0D8XWC3_DICVI|nr:RWD domain protein [Dictyocaulus viviparus]
MEDYGAQQTELEVLQSIFGDLISFESEHKIRISFDDDVKLLVTLPVMNSSQEPARYELSGPSLSTTERYQLQSALNDVEMEDPRSQIIYSWIMVVKNFMETRVSPKLQCSSDSTDQDESVVSRHDIVVPVIHHGEVLTDRKSHFQAHLAKVTSEQEVAVVLERLLENPKIARATHNMYAYRIVQFKNGHQSRLHNCFDDGETGASSKMLHILEKMNADNVLVIVTRWYGGIHLGPDRFRHINNLTRDIVSKHGLNISQNNVAAK